MSAPLAQPGTAGDQAIDYFSKGHPLRAWATQRAVRARLRMLDQFAARVPFDRTSAVIDIGITPDAELADSNIFERWYPHPERITATSVEDASAIERRYPGVRFVQTDGERLPFSDRSFDVSFCSAVLEHVGGPEAQRRFVTEMVRVSDRFFLTTPNRWFPLELHTFLPLVHWLPRGAHRWLLRRLGLRFWADPANLNLVSASQLRAMFPPEVHVMIVRNRTLGLCSNLIAVGHRRASHRESPTGPEPAVRSGHESA
ncbi:MAG: class I SAM-dependent methyltransferase [Acidimicrobiales bacterium]